MEQTGISSPSAQPNSRQQPPQLLSRDYVAMVNAALAVASTRILSLIAMIGAVSMFAYAVYDPMPVRSYTAGAYAVLVLGPMLWALIKKG